MRITPAPLVRKSAQPNVSKRWRDKNTPEPSANAAISGVKRIQKLLNAERTAAAAGALHVRIVELEPGTFQSLDVIDLNSLKVHRAHLVHGHFQTVKIEHFVVLRSLVLKCHVILKARTAAA